MSTWVYPRSNNLLTLSQAAIVTTARHLCTKLNSVYNLYTFLYRFLGHLRVYTWVFLYPSVARYPLATFGSKKQPPVWYLKARAPVWYLKARTPPLPVLTGLHLGLPLPPSGVVPLWPLSSLGNSPQSGISKPEPPVWYLKARAPPLSCLLLGLPLLPHGVVQETAPSLVSQSQSPHCRVSLSL